MIQWDAASVVAIIMLLGVILTSMIGYPLAVMTGSIGLIVGILFFGLSPTLELLYTKSNQILMNYNFIAIPMFVFMGCMLEASGIADDLYDAVYGAFGKMRGGLAISTILIGTILAAAVGILGASVTMLTLVALPSMLNKKYNKGLACGACMAGGSLGILIPPSVMLVTYGPMASISVGKLFMGAFIPGFLLSALYCTYCGVVCFLKPSWGPGVSEADTRSLGENIRRLLFSVLPVAILIFSVLGVIFLGIAPATQASCIGATAAIVMAAARGKLNLKVLGDACAQTLKISSTTMMVGAFTSFFVGVFIRLGGQEVVSTLLTSAPGGKWGTFALIVVITVLLGMVMEWLGVLFIMVPLVTPIITALGFDPLWFAIMMCVILQSSFLSPPVAPAMFYMRTALKPEWGITMRDMIMGVVPFIVIIIITVALLCVFPDIVTFLPNRMIGA